MQQNQVFEQNEREVLILMGTCIDRVDFQRLADKIYYSWEKGHLEVVISTARLVRIQFCIEGNNIW